ncbi:DedA family protein [Micromonospora sp. WMMD956]|uniref:DedA family protein n=1 Tax=Micromonospora sp. WMMD956 TaxID=3016108 RepID=UPI002416123A|nr:DedA family protein [Micromonospora sp. WMMD956]MDG4813899.1 DedA family protein [Micromonospora sp. WMMD956]MDG4819897.1 DedA family protein [Micromonospora sp. WMMD956]
MISTQPLLPFPRTVAAGPEPGSDGPVGFVTGLVERLGGPGAGLAVALENLFPPIPSEVILPLAGFVASQGRMSLVGAIGWTTLGSVVGALALYWIGAMLGRDRMRAIAAKLPLVKLEDVDRTEAWFLRHGVKAVFFGRMIPVFRSLISIPAGVERMPVLTFLLYTTLGSLIWNTVFVLAGYLLGENWHVVEAYVGTFQNVVIAVSALAVAWFVVTRVRRSRAARRDAVASASTSVSASANSSVGGPSVGGPSAEERGGDLVGFAGGPAGHGPSAGADRGLPTGPERGTGEYRGTVYRSGSWRGGPEH